MFFRNDDRKKSRPQNCQFSFSINVSFNHSLHSRFAAIIRDVTRIKRRPQLESYDSRAFVKSSGFLRLEIDSKLLKRGDTYIT